MSEADVIDMLKAGLWVAFVISGPILGISLIVGTLIGLFQALTSVQELTLTFVPKLAAIFLTFWLSVGFMGASLVAFYKNEVIEAVVNPR